MTTSTQSLPVGYSTAVKRVSTSFLDVKKVIELGPSPHGKKRYWVKVELQKGRMITIQIESKSLTAAFEMIEAIARQTGQLSDPDYRKFMKSHRGKRIWFGMTKDPKNPGGVIVTIYRTDRHNALKLVGQPTAILKDTVDDVKEISKLHKSKPSVRRGHKMRVALRKKI